MVEVAASLLAADLTSLRNEISTVSAADRLHIDIMDGHFVQNISLGFDLAEQISNIPGFDSDIHLMVDNPSRHVARLLDLGATSVTVHAEACDEVRAFDRFRSRGIDPGIAVNPDTDIEDIDRVIDAVERVTVMGVTPGFAGQDFIPSTIDKVRDLSEVFSGTIEVDGGVDVTVSADCIEAGADVLVSGTCIFCSEDRNKTIRQLRERTDSG